MYDIEFAVGLLHRDMARPHLLYTSNSDVLSHTCIYGGSRPYQVSIKFVLGLEG